MQEIITFITVLKAMGFDTGKIIEIFFIILMVLFAIAFVYYKWLRPMVNGFKDTLTKNVDKAVNAGVSNTELIEALSKNLASAKDSFDDFHNTLKEHVMDSNKKFNTQASEIKELATQIKQTNELNGRQFNEVARQVRYLYTKLQIQAPRDDEGEQTKSH